MAPKKKVVKAAAPVAVPAPTAVAPAAANEINAEQTLKASKALLAHMQKASKQKAEASTKKNLLDEIDEDGALALSETPVWLTLTTKRHIVDTNKLKPDKISVPHPLHTNPNETICLITADPQRSYKDIIASDDFPADLRKRITRVIGYTKVRAKYRQYEAQRQLLSSHDIFISDDRIINRLPQALGKTFYKTTAKRPIPVTFRTARTAAAGKKGGKRQDGDEVVNVPTAADVAAEVNKALGCALVALSPSTNTAIKVGYASWTAEQIAENVAAVATSLISKHVPKGWSNVKSIYIKGPETTALPIWQTEELWVDGADVVADKEGETKAVKDVEKANVGKKRKSLEEEKPESKKGPLSKKVKKLPESNDDDLKKQISETKTRLRKQKAASKAALDD
ncbi:related to CIC1 Adaptor protein specifically linking the 26S proteasome to its substrate, the SCF component Cdc4 [Cephalotrichum gorgonifer]|uniref:Related to CIC1 Adaptor protein specifically linking the 26S proteasome to its substrate, the SCF component Cdc4 n=1 Tax=Cephalotrichum gorgonifer TaxID=2041049 RepID=A0AAE8SRP1_9PEZI|nr:related to CIC1 Adaptor protein specifically linking the 26S proteasome to its substrate, the SCF component Cdc4 [Cephalotrichum gorgonifer]